MLEEALSRGWEELALAQVEAASQGVVVSGYALWSQARCYTEQLLERNSKVNLTAITGEDEIAIKHFVDSWSILLLEAVQEVGLPPGSRWVDVGTGAGFPGIPCKLAVPGIFLTLVDALQKRVNFLRDAIAACSLTGVEVVHARAEELGRMAGHRERYDVATARAVAALPVLAEYCLPLVRQGGVFIAMKGPAGDEEAEQAGGALRKLGGRLEQVVPIRLPLLGDERRLVVVRKTGPTPSIYPRRSGLPERKPLA